MEEARLRKEKDEEDWLAFEKGDIVPDTAPAAGDPATERELISEVELTLSSGKEKPTSQLVATLYVDQHAAHAAYDFCSANNIHNTAEVAKITKLLKDKVRCAFSNRILHLRMPLDPTHVRLTLLQAYDQWHSSRVSPPLTGWHRKLRPLQTSDQWHSSRKSTRLPVCTVNCVQTLKAGDEYKPPADIHATEVLLAAARKEQKDGNFAAAGAGWAKVLHSHDNGGPPLEDEVKAEAPCSYFLTNLHSKMQLRFTRLLA
jgi:hypothetical protein